MGKELQKERKDSDRVRSKAPDTRTGLDNKPSAAPYYLFLHRSEKTLISGLTLNFMMKIFRELYWNAMS